jgi:hypothetical protein
MMFGLNAQAWLSDHHRQHQVLMQLAAINSPEPVSKPAPAPALELACC